MQFDELIDDPQEEEIIDSPIDHKQAASPEDQDYFEVLKATNALTLPDDYEFTSLEQAIEDHRKFTYDSAKQEVLSSVPQELKDLVEYALEGGSSLKEYLDKTRTIDFENLDLEEVEDQKKVMYNYYKMTSNHDDKKIQRLIGRLEESGDLENEAKETLDEVISLRKENARKLIEQQKAQEKLEEQKLNEKIQELTASLEKTNFSIDRKNRIKSFIFTTTSEGSTQFTQALNQVYSNPQHFIEFANFLSNYHPSKGFDYERLKKQLQTENVKTIKEVISEKLDARTKVAGRPGGNPAEDFDWDRYFSK